MGGCVSTKHENERDERQDPTRERLIRNAGSVQPRQHGGPPAEQSRLIRNAGSNQHRQHGGPPAEQTRLIRNAGSDQHRQHGGTPAEQSPTQSVREFLMECVFSKWCFGGFGDEMDSILAPRAPLLSEAERMECENPTQIPDHVELTNSADFAAGTEVNDQGPSDTDQNVGTGADGSVVAGTGTDDSAVVGKDKGSASAN